MIFLREYYSIDVVLKYGVLLLRLIMLLGCVRTLMSGRLFLAILPFLLQASYQLSDHISSKMIELISLAITTNSSSRKHDKQERKEKSKRKN